MVVRAVGEKVGEGRVVVRVGMARAVVVRQAAGTAGAGLVAARNRAAERAGDGERADRVAVMRMPAGRVAVRADVPKVEEEMAVATAGKGIGRGWWRWTGWWWRQGWLHRSYQAAQ